MYVNICLLLLIIIIKSFLFLFYILTINNLISIFLQSELFLIKIHKSIHKQQLIIINLFLQHVIHCPPATLPIKSNTCFTSFSSYWINFSSTLFINEWSTLIFDIECVRSSNCLPSSYKLYLISSNRWNNFLTSVVRLLMISLISYSHVELIYFNLFYSR